MKRLKLLMPMLFLSQSMFAQIGEEEITKLATEKKWSELEQKLLSVPLEKRLENRYYSSALMFAQVNQKKCEAVQNTFKELALYDTRPESLNDGRYLLAKCYLLDNNDGEALKLLRVASRFGGGGQVLVDNSFSKLADNKDFQAIKSSIQENVRPCENNENYRKLDFFVGNWDIYLGDGYDQKVAVDTIEKVTRGCAILENFYYTAGKSTFTGKSFCFYDAPKQKFVMNWAGSSGDIRIFEETASSKNSMELMAITIGNSNRMLVHRKMKIDYNPTDDTIHQFIQNSYDLGKTWVTEWDALYRRQKAN
jgi:hypothetical protein